MALPSPPGGGPPAWRRFGLPALFVVVLFAVVWMRRPDSPASQLHEFQGQTMGTTWTVKVVTSADPAAQTAGLLAQIPEVTAKALDQVDWAMSTYKPESELSRFNRHPVGESFDASPSLRLVMEEAQRVHRDSGGAFDVTVGPLVDAWGFGPDGEVDPPSQAQLTALRDVVGSQYAPLDGSGVRRLRDGVRVDLSAIAKGFAVDQVAEALEGLGVDRYMVEVGGETRVLGRSQRDEPWRLGIERPDTPTREAIRVVSLDHGALATSGDYRNYREVNGKRVSHTIDPRTGRPIEHNLASVSVVHERCMTADAWATALNVLGPTEGLALATKLGLAATFLVREDADFEEHSTPAFDAIQAKLKQE